MAPPTLASSTFDYPAIVNEAIENHIKPQYDRLNSATTALAAVMKKACGGEERLRDPDIIPAFRAVAVAWGGAQHLHWGPAREEYRYERMSFGSDPKNYAGRQLRSLIVQADFSALNLETFRSKSVAVQGLTALELLIYKQSSSAADARYRCALAEIIAQNVANMARDIVAGWENPQGYAALMMAPGPENPLFRNQQEAAMGAFKPLAGGLRFMIDIKLKDPLQESADKARPRYFEFWRNGATKFVLMANMKALSDLYLNGGFAAQVAAHNEELDDQVRAKFSQAIEILDNIEMPLPKAVKDPQARAKLIDLIAVLEHLWKIIAFEVAGTLELSVGFNEFDGD